MTEAEVRATVERYLPMLVEALGLGGWHIDVRYERIEHGTPGNCSVLPPYQRINICLDAEQLDDEAEAVSVLRHELCHAFLWPFHSFGDMVQQSFPDEQMPSMGFHSWVFYLERAVGEVEALLDRHDIGVPSVAAD